FFSSVLAAHPVREATVVVQPMAGPACAGQGVRTARIHHHACRLRGHGEGGHLEQVFDAERVHSMRPEMKTPPSKGAPVTAMSTRKRQRRSSRCSFWRCCWS